MMPEYTATFIIAFGMAVFVLCAVVCDFYKQKKIDSLTKDLEMYRKSLASKDQYIANLELLSDKNDNALADIQKILDGVRK